MIFEQTLSNFGLTATFRVKLLLQPHDKIIRFENWILDCLLFLWEHSFKFHSFCHIYFFARMKCPSEVRFSQANRLNGQKLSNVRLLFSYFTIFKYVMKVTSLPLTWQSLSSSCIPYIMINIITSYHWF